MASSAGPVKRKPGYANFAIAEPPLKLVLLENPGQDGEQRSDAAQAELDGNRL